MISEGRIPMTEEEAEAVRVLLDDVGDRVTLSRRDPGNTGPLLVQTDTTSFLIAPDMSGGVSVTEV